MKSIQLKKLCLIFVCFHSLINLVSSNATVTQTNELKDLLDKLNERTEKIFRWNVFNEESKSPKEHHIFFSSNSNTKQIYFYGCKCESLNCSCCAHIEVTNTKLNHTGK